MAFCFAFTGPLRENNALELVNQSGRYIDYKHKPYDKCSYRPDSRLVISTSQYTPLELFFIKSAGGNSV